MQADTGRAVFLGCEKSSSAVTMVRESSPNFLSWQRGYKNETPRAVISD